MLSIALVVVSLCSLHPLVQSATPYKDCGSELGTVQLFEVTGCTTAPCKFSKGNTYSMNLTFLAKATSKSASVSIHGKRRSTPSLLSPLTCSSSIGVIAGVPVPFPIPESNACKLNVKCPVNANDANIAQLSLAVLPSYPSISLYAKIEIKADDQSQDYVCLQFPATITSGTDHGRNLVGWQKGKLFEMLDETL